MTKFALGLTALVISIVFVAISLCDREIARDIALIYVAVLLTILSLAHSQGT